MRKEVIKKMKPFRILSKNIKDAFKSIFRNFSLSFASIICTTITLLMVAIAIIVSINVNDFTKEIENNLSIIVFLDRSATIDDATNIQKKIKEDKRIDSIIFESKEDVKKEMQKESEVFNSIMSEWTEDTNPLQHEFSIKVKQAEDLKAVSESIKKMNHIDSVKYGEGIVDKLVSTFNIVEKATIVVVIALILVTAFLISNTIKITIYSRKNEIDIMRLVGTSNIVIKLPFLFEGFILGIIGAIVPIVVTIYGYMLAYDKLDGHLFSNIIRLENPTNIVFKVSLVLVVIGAIVGMISSYRSARKYLKI